MTILLFSPIISWSIVDDKITKEDADNKIDRGHSNG